MMIAMKKVLVLTLLGFVAVLAYQWGNSDGQAGREFQFVDLSVAAGNSSEFSPVKARARDFYAPN